MSRTREVWSHLVLVLSVSAVLLPLYLAIVAASHEGSAMMHMPLPIFPGMALWKNVVAVFSHNITGSGGASLAHILLNSFWMALLIAVGKIILALFSAFSLIYFSFPFKKCCFALIFSTMMLPVEVRIVPTFQIVASLGWLNTFSGLTLPLLASATATFLFRQCFKTIPSELVDAAILDGAGPMRFFFDVLLPLSRSQIGALLIIMFVYGWNQYLWPLVITTNSQIETVVMGIKYLAGVADQAPQWHYIMTVALVALLPPCLIVIILQHWFEKGLKT